MSDIEEKSEHILSIGGREFVCANKLPLGRMLRAAKLGDLAVQAAVMEGLISDDEIDDFYDVLDDVDQQEFADAFQDLMEGYSKHPLGQRSSSGSTHKPNHRR